MSYKSRFPITGRCTSTENAIKFFEMLPDSIPEEIKMMTSVMNTKKR